MTVNHALQRVANREATEETAYQSCYLRTGLGVCSVALLQGFHRKTLVNTKGMHQSYCKDTTTKRLHREACTAPSGCTALAPGMAPRLSVHQNLVTLPRGHTALADLHKIPIIQSLNYQLYLQKKSPVHKHQLQKSPPSSSSHAPAPWVPTTNRRLELPYHDPAVTHDQGRGVLIDRAAHHAEGTDSLCHPDGVTLAS